MLFGLVRIILLLAYIIYFGWNISLRMLVWANKFAHMQCLSKALHITMANFDY
jgi:hypothetical protein